MSSLVDKVKETLNIGSTSTNTSTTSSTSSSMSSSSIPKQWKAAQVKSKGKIEVGTVQGPKELKHNQVLLKVHANGVCHSDLFTLNAVYPIDFPLVPGHEIIGEIVAKGDQVPEQYKVGDRYGRGWFGGCCFSCDACRRGDFNTCDANMISGISDDGGYAEYVVSPWEALAKVPDSLKSEEAAPLMCAGVTVFNAIRNAGALPPATVAVVGIGGLGHLAIQFAKAMGYRVIAVSSSDKKKDQAMKLGATEYIDSSKGDVGEQLQKFGGARVIVCTTTDAELMSKLATGGLSRNGVFLAIGASPDPIKAPSVALIGKRTRIQGWPAGTSKDSEDTLLFAALHNIRPHVTSVPLDKAAEAIEAIEKGTVHGRQVLVCNH